MRNTNAPWWTLAKWPTTIAIRTRSSKLPATMQPGAGNENASCVWSATVRAIHQLAGRQTARAACHAGAGGEHSGCEIYRDLAAGSRGSDGCPAERLPQRLWRGVHEQGESGS